MNPYPGKGHSQGSVPLPICKYLVTASSERAFSLGRGVNMVGFHAWLFPLLFVPALISLPDVGGQDNSGVRTHCSLRPFYSHTLPGQLLPPQETVTEYATFFLLSHCMKGAGKGQTNPRRMLCMFLQQLPASSRKTCLVLLKASLDQSSSSR